MVFEEHRRHAVPRFVRLIAVLAAASFVGASAVSVAQAKPKHTDAKSADAKSADAKPAGGRHDSWIYETDKQDQPSLSYRNAKGETVFSVSCGAHFEMFAVYPGVTKKDGDTASITIANGKTSMDFAGDIFTAETEMPRGANIFSQPDLGFARQDPDLYGDKWHAQEDQFFDFLASGAPLKISAEDRSYTLPAVNAPRWKQRFRKIC
jgi:hypothetical protein